MILLNHFNLTTSDGAMSTDEIVNSVKRRVCIVISVNFLVRL
jgi:hypothetical protein